MSKTGSNKQWMQNGGCENTSVCLYVCLYEFRCTFWSRLETTLAANLNSVIKNVHDSQWNMIFCGGKKMVWFDMYPLGFYEKWKQKPRRIHFYQRPDQCKKVIMIYGNKKPPKWTKIPHKFMIRGKINEYLFITFSSAHIASFLFSFFLSFSITVLSLIINHTAKSW